MHAAHPIPSRSSSIIDDLKLINPQVVVKGSGDDGHPCDAAHLELKDIGTGDGAQNGAAVKDVVTQIITAMAATQATHRR